MRTYHELWHDRKTTWLKTCDYPQEQNSNIVIVKAMHSLVSQGTERLVTSESLPEETGKNMKVPYMKGDFSDKFTYGYSLVGEVVKGPKKMVGHYAQLLHPHQEMAFVSVSDVSIIPYGIPPKLASLASNMETAVNAVWDAEIDIGDRVLIVGYGVIGALVASQVSKFPGIFIAIVELNDQRAAKARGQGFTVVESIMEINLDFDVAFNASASESGLQLAIDSTITDGKIIELSWYGSKHITVDLGSAFHYGRKRIISSQVSNIPARKKHNWTFEKRKNLVFDLLKHTDLTELLTNEIQFNEAPAYYTRLRNGEIDEFSTLINYDS